MPIVSDKTLQPGEKKRGWVGRFVSKPTEPVGGEETDPRSDTSDPGGAPQVDVSGPPAEDDQNKST